MRTLLAVALVVILVSGGGVVWRAEQLGLIDLRGYGELLLERIRAGALERQYPGHWEAIASTSWLPVHDESIYFAAGCSIVVRSSAQINYKTAAEAIDHTFQNDTRVEKAEGRDATLRVVFPHQKPTVFRCAEVLPTHLLAWCIWKGRRAPRSRELSSTCRLPQVSADVRLNSPFVDPFRPFQPRR